MYKHNFVAGDEVAPIEIQLNATSRISSIAAHLHCTYYKMMCTQRLRLQIKTCRLMISFACNLKLFIPFCSFLYVHIRHERFCYQIHVNYIEIDVLPFRCQVINVMVMIYKAADLMKLCGCV